MRLPGACAQGLRAGPLGPPGLTAVYRPGGAAYTGIQGIHSYAGQDIEGVHRLAMLMREHGLADTHCQHHAEGTQAVPVAAGSVAGICAEESCPHHQELPGADIAVIKNTLPADFRVYTYADTAWFVERGGGPFRLVN